MTQSGAGDSEVSRPSTQELVARAWRQGRVIPGFNIPYLPMMAPVVRALRDTDSLGLIMVARLEWTKFESGSVAAIRDEFVRLDGDPRHVRLHLDHVPVVDEDGLRVDYAAIIATALDCGYESVMVDASRLPLADNAACTRNVVEMAHARGVPVEGELGAVLGHESGPLPPYETLFAARRGFTDPDDARQFVHATGVDWLSVAIGNVHGAIATATRTAEKVAARLDIAHLERIREATGVPLVLHGGTGISKALIQESVRHGIAKINVATAIRQPYERLRAHSVAQAQDAVYEEMLRIIRDELGIAGLASRLQAD